MDPSFHSFERSIEDWHFWYQGRRLILDMLLGALDLPPGALLLDIGCGTGGTALVLERHGTAIGQDRSTAALRLAAGRPYSLRVAADAEALPYKDGQFDAVVAMDVLEHLDDDVAAVREIRRVLRPGGSAIIFVPAFQILWGHNDVLSHHRRRYRKEGLVDALREGGLLSGPSGYFNLLLFLPTLMSRLGERVLPRASHRLEYGSRPGPLNDLLLRIFRLELGWLRHRPLPLGTSAYCVAMRPSEST